MLRRRNGLPHPCYRAGGRSGLARPPKPPAPGATPMNAQNPRPCASGRASRFRLAFRACSRSRSRLHAHAHRPRAVDRAATPCLSPRGPSMLARGPVVRPRRADGAARSRCWIYEAVLPDRWRASRTHRVLRFTWLAFVLFVLLFGAVAEATFWLEFATRFNFIAVDYLLYTHEVVGNIRESYPVPWILTGLALAAAGDRLLSCGAGCGTRTRDPRRAGAGWLMWPPPWRCRPLALSDRVRRPDGPDRQRLRRRARRQRVVHLRRGHAPQRARLRSLLRHHAAGGRRPDPGGARRRAQAAGRRRTPEPRSTRVRSDRAPRAGHAGAAAPRGADHGGKPVGRVRRRLRLDRRPHPQSGSLCARRPQIHATPTPPGRAPCAGSRRRRSGTPPVPGQSIVRRPGQRASGDGGRAAASARGTRRASSTAGTATSTT